MWSLWCLGEIQTMAESVCWRALATINEFAFGRLCDDICTKFSRLIAFFGSLYITVFIKIEKDEENFFLFSCLMFSCLDAGL